MALKKVSKNDKLRMLARMAYSFSARLNLDENKLNLRLNDHTMEALHTLTRFVRRNIDNAEDKESLTHDDISDFDMQDLTVLRREDSFTCVVNDQLYHGDFIVRWVSKDGPEAQLGTVYKLNDIKELDKPDRILEDALLLEFINIKLTEYVRDHEAEYAAVEDAREADRRAEAGMEDYRERNED